MRRKQLPGNTSALQRDASSYPGKEASGCAIYCLLRNQTSQKATFHEHLVCGRERRCPNSVWMCREGARSFGFQKCLGSGHLSGNHTFLKREAFQLARVQASGHMPCPSLGEFSRCGRQLSPKRMLVPLTSILASLPRARRKGP